jgi:transcriptional regulator with XRE-family HTH domain
MEEFLTLRQQKKREIEPVLKLPHAKPTPSPGRDLEICRLREIGLTLDAIARLFGISRARVAQIIKKAPKIRRRHEAQAIIAKALDGRQRSAFWVQRHDWTPEKQEEEIRRERKEIVSKLEQLPAARMKL